MEELKYFIPEISDIKIGYECEIQTNKGTELLNNGKEEWKKFCISNKEENELGFKYTNQLSNIINGFEFGQSPVKTAYLTKEQIEKEGWLFLEENKIDKNNTDDTRTIITYKKGNYTLVHAYIDFSEIKKCIQIWYNHPIHCIFEGEIKSINEFRTLLKWLNIC